MQLPENLPHAIRNAILWIACTAAIGGWIGFVPPWTMANRTLEEWVKAHAQATATIEQQGRSISVLQDRDGRTQDEIKSMRQQINEALKILYTMERRSR